MGDSTIQASDVANEARGLLGEYFSTGQFGDGQMLDWVNRAQKWVVKKIRAPHAIQAFSTIPNVQEYPLEEAVRILRVYMAGTIIPRTDIPTLEGRQVEMYDNTAQGLGPSGNVVFNIPSPGVTSGAAPQWSAQPAEPYPPVQRGGADFASPWFSGRRPVYYVRKLGLIGFIPIPTGIAPVRVECVKNAPKLTSLDDYLIIPDQALMCAAWLVCYFAYFQDRENDGAPQLRAEAMTNAREELGDLIKFVRNYDGDGPNGPKLNTGRRTYRNRIGW
jgi:hypothetical protein